MILVNGDSFTFGDELTDVKHAWPRLLEIHEVCNLAKSGYSNDAIVKSTVIAIEELSIKCNGAIIAWTTPNRIELNGKHLTPTSHRKYGSICDHVFLDWDENWALAKFTSQVCLLDSYLRDKGIPYLFVRTFGVPDVNKGTWADGEMIEWMDDCPKGLGGHPLELGHQRIAKKINDYIRNIGWIS